MPLSPLLRAEVDLGALRRNVRRIREMSGGVPLLAAVKSNAYGHGVLPVVAALRDEGVEHLAVARLSEGVALREAGVGAPVLVFGAPLPEQVAHYAAYDLALTVSSPEVAAAVVQAAARAPLTVHVKVDTGMGRIGLRPEEAPGVLEGLRAAPGVTVAGLWTHFATADDDVAFAEVQLARFEAVVAAAGAADVPLHLANGGAIAHLPAAVRGRAFVRAGGILYGCPPTREVDAVAQTEPVMRLVTRVLHLKTVQPGETVSYGRTWRAERPTRIATLAVGYGDGYPRQLSNRGRVGIRGALYPIAGRVCMDLTMLDLGDPDGPGAAVEVGDDAVLFGPGGEAVLDVAERAETLSYVLPCGLTARVPRVYRDRPSAG